MIKIVQYFFAYIMNNERKHKRRKAKGQLIESVLELLRNIQKVFVSTTIRSWISAATVQSSTTTKKRLFRFFNIIQNGSKES